MPNIATTQLGPNSWVIAYAMGTTVAQVSSEVTAVLALAGWDVYDAIAGTNAVCYRAPNKDGTTFKYVVLNYNTTGWLFLQVYESWNALTHVGTNQCSKGTDTSVGYQQVLNLSSDKGLIYIFANPRYVALGIRQYSSAVFGNTVTCGVTGCFEFGRENPDDTVAAGYPIYCFMNTGRAGENTGNPYETLSLPRTRFGTSGGNLNGELSTIFGKTLYTSSVSLKTFLPNSINLFSNKDWAISLYVQDGTAATPSVRGRMFGLKAFTQDRLSFLDKVQVPVDEDLNYNPNGLLTDHFIIPGGCQGSGLYNVRFLLPV